MTPAPQQAPKEQKKPKADDLFLITRHELTLFAANGFWDHDERIQTLHAVESRPHPAPATSEIERFNRAMISGHTISKEVEVGISFSAQQLKDHDVAIRAEAARKAREDFIKGLLVWIQENEQFTGCDNIDGFEIYGVLSTDIKKYLESLSPQHPGQEGERG